MNIHSCVFKISGKNQSIPDRHTDGHTDGRTDGQHENSISHHKVCGKVCVCVGGGGGWGMGGGGIKMLPLEC